MSRMRKVVLSEPLVAVVEHKRVVSNYCLLKVCFRASPNLCPAGLGLLNVVLELL